MKGFESILSSWDCRVCLYLSDTLTVSRNVGLPWYTKLQLVATIHMCGSFKVVGQAQESTYIFGVLRV